MSQVLDTLADARIVPVVVLRDAAHAVPLGEALVAGGLPLAEVTFRTPAAAEAIRLLTRHTACVVGAGTVLTAAQVHTAVAAGATFVVSPGLDPAVVRECQTLGVPVLPGVATPSEIQRALSLGLDAVKLFPADIVGGPAAVRAFAGPFGGLRLVPTGGVDLDNLAAYLALPSVLAVGGTWMAPAALVEAQEWGRIRELTVAAVAAADAARPREVGTLR